MRTLLVLMLACGGCSPLAPIYVQRTNPYVPVVDSSCPVAASTPAYPPRIMSVVALRLFAQDADAARIHDRAALRECTMRLHKAVAVLDALRAGQPAP